MDRPFPNQIKTKIFEALTIAAIETPEIEVITCIDSSDLDLPENSLSTSGFRTQINLWEKTVDHEIDLKLIDNPAYGELQRWHIEQVYQTQNSVTENFASLEKMRRFFL